MFQTVSASKECAIQNLPMSTTQNIQRNETKMKEKNLKFYVQKQVAVRIYFWSGRSKIKPNREL
jgi:hypothetical protein